MGRSSMVPGRILTEKGGFFPLISKRPYFFDIKVLSEKLNFVTREFV